MQETASCLPLPHGKGRFIIQWQREGERERGGREERREREGEGEGKREEGEGERLVYQTWKKMSVLFGVLYLEFSPPPPHFCLCTYTHVHICDCPYLCGCSLLCIWYTWLCMWSLESNIIFLLWSPFILSFEPESLIEREAHWVTLPGWWSPGPHLSIYSSAVFFFFSQMGTTPPRFYPVLGIHLVPQAGMTSCWRRKLLSYLYFIFFHIGNKILMVNCDVYIVNLRYYGVILHDWGIQGKLPQVIATCIDAS